MKEDKTLILGMIGVFSTIISEIITWIGKLSGLANYSDYELTSLIITLNRPTVLLGFVIEGSIGVIISIVLFKLVKETGEKYILLKSVITGIVAWIIIEILITMIVEGKTIPLRELAAYYTHLIGAIGFGITQGLLFKRYILSKFHSKEQID
ncbi:hypothetical protein [Ruminiclostridium cellobioparum]|uniref:Uncharacterized protein n=1 Tax=Ruminiclostridium cellobioparum subsp. termitidis CT1112 TaxID=1195236 RepID=S0FII1_RUMCE|nr:hypothetical protein [Ruminiclostridium cellobioparum]EMS69936.1 hypothetical protein CTER_4405 [Ruminiclostridium cellobioparum subsp. termitidis CT1112]